MVEAVGVDLTSGERSLLSAYERGLRRGLAPGAAPGAMSYLDDVGLTRSAAVRPPLPGVRPASWYNPSMVNRARHQMEHGAAAGVARAEATLTDAFGRRLQIIAR